MKILTGSWAAHFWIPEFRIGNDIDWMISEGEEVKDGIDYDQSVFDF